MDWRVHAIKHLQMIFWDGVRLAASNYYELRSYVDKLGFNPEQIVSEHRKMWVYLQGWQTRVLDKEKIRRVTASDLNRLTASYTETELREAREAYEQVVASKIIAKDEQVVGKKGRSYALTYRATGEKALFQAIQEQRMDRGVLRSDISGERLITDVRHKLWVNQFMHCLPKGNYGRYRLLPENIFLGTVAEHHLQTVNPGKTRELPEWAEFWAKYEELKIRYHQELHSNR